MKTALDVLDEYKQTPRGSSITYVDFQGDHVVLGSSSGEKVSAGPMTRQRRCSRTTLPANAGGDSNGTRRENAETRRSRLREEASDVRATSYAGETDGDATFSEATEQTNRNG